MHSWKSANPNSAIDERRLRPLRAVWVREHGAPETSRIEEVPAPEIGDAQVLIEVKAIGVNYLDFLVIGFAAGGIPEQKVKS